MNSNRTFLSFIGCLLLWSGNTSYLWAKNLSSELGGDFESYRVARKFIDDMVVKHGFDRNHLNEIFSQARNHQQISETINRSVETTGIGKGSWNRYKESHINQHKLNLAKKLIRNNEATLQRAQKVYGVPVEYIVATIGIETEFGDSFGVTPIISALATISFSKSRRSKYFLRELEEFLIMCRREKINPLKPKGSYAGAMGYGQFMPSSFRKYMVDFDKNGKKDLWSAADMIGSIGNYFHKNGWRKGKIPAVPATIVGAKYKQLAYGWRYPYTLSQLAHAGIKPRRKLDSDKYYFIKLVTYSGDELWIGGDNFYVITRYNNSSKYAMIVFLFANSIKNI